jgi:sphingomyelin phosphodiesterase acid-like 3
MRKLIKQFILLSALLSSSIMAMPLVGITPNDYSYHDQSAALGTTITVPYLVTNNTPATLSSITATGLPSGITSTTCANIAPHSSCTLKISITSRLTSKPGSIRAPFQVCAHGSSTGCTNVDATYQIDINVTDNNTFLAITDIHLKDGKPATIAYGEDTGDALWQSTKTEISTLINEQDPKFIVLLGDLPAHHDIPNLPQNLGAVLTGFSNHEAISRENIPVFFVFGNNDSLTSNYGPFSNNGVNLFSLDPQHNTPENKGWPALNANPDCSISPTTACTYTTTAPMPQQHAEDMAHAQSLGYYSAYPLGSTIQLRFISMNTIIFSHEYAITGAAQLAQAQAQMDWLASQLASASANGEAVYIGMHIPPGDDAFNHGEDMWNDTLILNNGMTFRNAFIALMAQYKNTVRVIMSGHTHLSELRAIYADRGLNDLSVLDVGIPGLTPQHFNNASMQLYLYNHHFELTETKTFFTLPAATNWNSYSFRNDYQCPAGSIMLSCVADKLLPKLSDWKLSTQPIMNNIYELNYGVRAPEYDPSLNNYSSWLAILSAIQVVPRA